MPRGVLPFSILCRCVVFENTYEVLKRGNVMLLMPYAI